MSEHQRERTTEQVTGRLERAAVYRGHLADGRLLDTRPAARMLAWLRAALSSKAARAEAQLEHHLAAQQRRPARANVVAVASPKGGVGKTTCTLLVGDALCELVRLRCVAVDANPDYGTLGSLATDELRSPHSLADVLHELDRLDAAAALRPFVSPLASGLHLLAAPGEAGAMAELDAEDYRRLLDALCRFYDVVLLDLGTGLTDPLARFALERSDQTMLVATPEWVTVERVLAALDDLGGTLDPAATTLVLNQAPADHAGDRQVIEAAFRHADVGGRITIPYDPRLRAMLDAGAYHLADLDHATRLPVKQLGLRIAEALA